MKRASLPQAQLAGTEFDGLLFMEPNQGSEVKTLRLAPLIMAQP